MSSRLVFRVVGLFLADSAPMLEWAVGLVGPKDLAYWTIAGYLIF